MEGNREPRNKPSESSTKQSSICSGEKTAPSANGSGKTGLLSNTIHKNKVQVDSRPKCKTQNCKIPRTDFTQQRKSPTKLIRQPTEWVKIFVNYV